MSHLCQVKTHSELKRRWPLPFCVLWFQACGGDIGRGHPGGRPRCSAPGLQRCHRHAGASRRNHPGVTLHLRPWRLLWWYAHWRAAGQICSVWRSHPHQVSRTSWLWKTYCMWSSLCWTTLMVSLFVQVCRGEDVGDFPRRLLCSRCSFSQCFHCKSSQLNLKYFKALKMLPWVYVPISIFL